MIFTPELVRLLAPGFAAAPGKFELAVTMTRIMFPFLLLVALAAQAMGVLNACNQFGVPAMSSTFFNVGSVGFGLALGFWLGPRLGHLAHRGHGVRRGDRRRAAVGLAGAQPAPRRLPLPASHSTGRIPACGTSCA